MKSKILGILFVFFSFGVEVLAQNLKGIVVSEINGDSLEGVSIKVKNTNISTLTNQEGIFNIILPKPNCVLIFTSIGFSQYELKLDSFISYKIITLTPVQIQLKEVIISEKKLGAQNYLKKALSKADSLYQSEIKLITGSYSETLLIKGSLVEYSNAIFQTKKRSTFTNISDSIYVLGIKNLRDSTANLPKIMQGIELVHSNDFILKRDSIFNKDFFKNTLFEFFDYANDSIVTINFKSIKSNSYSGQFVINLKDDAILKIELNRNVSKNKRSNTIVDYEFFEGKYKLKYIEKIVIKGQTKIIAKLKLHHTNDILTNQRNLYISNHSLNFHNNYQNQIFWKNYFKIEEDSLLKKQIYQLELKNANFSSQKTNNVKSDSAIFSNIYLLTSLDLKLDMFSGNEVFNHLDRTTFDLLSSKIENQGVSSLLQLVIPEIINNPIRNSIIEYQYLKLHNFSPKINPLVFNSFVRSYISNISLQELDKFRSNLPSEFMRIYTLRNEDNYAAIKALELEIFEKDLNKFNGVEDFLRVYFVDIFNRRFKQFGGITFSSLISSNSISSTFLRNPINLNPILTYTFYLHRPQSNFIGSIKDTDLNGTEKRFLKRARLKSGLNLISPFMIASPSINITDSLKMNFSFNYMLVPFGEFYEQKFYLKYRENNFGIFFRQFQNHYKVGLGVTLKHYQSKFIRGLNLDTEVSYFRQPNNLQFYDKVFKNGFSMNQTVLFNPFQKKYDLQKVKFMLGFLAKTDGYLPESFHLKQDFSGYFGLKLSL